MPFVGGTIWCGCLPVARHGAGVLERQLHVARPSVKRRRAEVELQHGTRANRRVRVVAARKHLFCQSCEMCEKLRSVQLQTDKSLTLAMNVHNWCDNVAGDRHLLVLSSFECNTAALTESECKSSHDTFVWLRCCR